MLYLTVIPAKFTMDLLRQYGAHFEFFWFQIAIIIKSQIHFFFSSVQVLFETMEFKIAAVSPKKSFQMQCKPIMLFQIIASDLRSGQYKMHTADYRLQIK